MKMKGTKEKIIHCLQSSEYSLSPKQIASFTKINYNTVRRILSQLRRLGIIKRQHRGYYDPLPRDGVGKDVLGFLPRVQNLAVIWEGVGIRKSEKVVYEFDGEEETCFRIIIIFGLKRGNVFWTCKAPVGLDLYGLRLAVKWVESECEKRGLLNPHWRVRNFEFLWDQGGIRLEGVEAVTIEDLDSTLEKYYNKGEGIRREVRSSRSIPMRDLTSLIQGGMTTYQVVQGVGDVDARIRELTEAMKGTNILLKDLIEISKANQQALYKVLNKSRKEEVS